MRNSFHGLREFVTRIDEAEKFNEDYLLPIALDVFGSAAFPVQTEYVGIKKSSRSKTATVARRLYFENYYSFVITDFFEGLHHGHYPRQCEICKKYFLMTSARRQKYCNGIAPYPDTLKRISDEVGLSEKTVSEILRSGFHNMQFVDFYRSYTDEDSEVSREDVTCDYTFEPCRELLRQERSEAVFGALDELSYREREVIRSHIGFCPDCHSMKSPKFRPHTFQEIAYKNELSSAEAAENIYRKGLDKMRDNLKKKGISSLNYKRHRISEVPSHYLITANRLRSRSYKTIENLLYP